MTIFLRLMKISYLDLMGLMFYYNRIDLNEGTDLAKLIAVKNI